MSAPDLNSEVAALASNPKAVILSAWLAGYQGFGVIEDYYLLPKDHIYGLLAVAYGSEKSLPDYLSLPKTYAWSDIYNQISGDSSFHSWDEMSALARILAALKGEDSSYVAFYQDLPILVVLALIVIEEGIDTTGFMLFDDGSGDGATLYDDGVTSGEVAIQG